METQNIFVISHPAQRGSENGTKIHTDECTHATKSAPRIEPMFTPSFGALSDFSGTERKKEKEHGETIKGIIIVKS